MTARDAHASKKECKGEHELKTMAELASQRVVLLGPKHNQGVSGVSDL